MLNSTATFSSIYFLIYFIRGPIAVKKHHDHDHGNSYKGKHFFVVARLQFRGLVHYWHGRKHTGRHGTKEGAEGSYNLVL